MQVREEFVRMKGRPGIMARLSIAVLLLLICGALQVDAQKPRPEWLGREPLIIVGNWDSMPIMPSLPAASPTAMVRAPATPAGAGAPALPIRRTVGRGRSV